MDVTSGDLTKAVRWLEDDAVSFFISGVCCAARGGGDKRTDPSRNYPPPPHSSLRIKQMFLNVFSSVFFSLYREPCLNRLRQKKKCRHL